MPAHLVTPRLLLRPFQPDDRDAVIALLSDPRNTRYMHFATWTDEQRHRWFERCLAQRSDATNWGITCNSLADVIGWFGIGGATHPSVAGERSFGYLLDHAHWNRGYMTEVLRAVLAYEFYTRGAPRLTATCEVANVASARVMEKVGMHWECTVRDTDGEGNWAERHHYAIDRDEHGA